MIENCDNFLICPEIEDEYDLGQDYVENLDVGFPKTFLGNGFESYIDYNSLGRDIALSSQGQFLDGCWIEYIG